VVHAAFQFRLKYLQRLDLRPSIRMRNIDHMINRSASRISSRVRPKSRDQRGRSFWIKPTVSSNRSHFATGSVSRGLWGPAVGEELIRSAKHLAPVSALSSVDLPALRIANQGDPLAFLARQATRWCGTWWRGSVLDCVAWPRLRLMTVANVGAPDQQLKEEWKQSAPIGGRDRAQRTG